MADENQVPEQKPLKPKKTKISIKFIGAGSIDIDEYCLKNGECIEIDSSKAERFLITGFFERK